MNAATGLEIFRSFRSLPLAPSSAGAGPPPSASLGSLPVGENHKSELIE